MKSRIAKKILRFARSEIKSWITLDVKRCTSLSNSKKKCIKSRDHLLWHEDAWRDWWW